MESLDAAVDALVLANKVLFHEGVVDAYGHVSIRHPECSDMFLLSRSRSPALVERDDLVTFTLDGEPAASENRPLYSERFIHAGVYRARSDVGAVVHSHAEAVLPFGLSTVKLRPVIHSASNMGFDVPVWDIADRFGDATDLLVRTLDQGDDLARTLGLCSVGLMRGHGFVAAAATLIEVLRLSVYTPKNARVQAAALQLGGGLKPLSTGEIDSRLFDAARPGKAATFDPAGSGLGRAWEHWQHLVGRCSCNRKEP